ncbi:uncharacterized protein LOC118405849 [Branchiostoma floridae]|uniref:Uncharacterized protein LOC118405849 n=1 Tax=Branchiostoma floridae TaxID=7739 RepID=C3YZ21_BRAFL|nr:uncharacterized protein LOC118405849 [Branchiostoma floridae]XP_035661548.1 uncharacterized protein LOC118405849 [Branchiostoma floridae]XP_035661549.1 uncharacterized protein LOC118405849 [Branchiostoma floridae]|eukprot:XP_002598517.1 hypothetical protein BRAFLDRAFT_118312 [Branchiostoma floridae]
MSASDTIAVPRSVEDITQPWVQQVFNKADPDVSITNVNIEGNIGEGQGYMNSLVAFVATGNKDSKEERHRLVAKLTSFQIMEEVDYMTVEDYLRMDTAESKFYSVAVPDLLSMLPASKGSEAMAEGEVVPVPKCYFATSDQTSKMSVRVMDNLKTQGFSIKPFPAQTLNLQEMKLAVGALARIHGLSHRLELQSGVPLPDRYDWMMDLHGTKQQWYGSRAAYLEGVKAFASAFPDATDLLACLEKLNTVPTVNEAVKNPEKVKVLSHTDCWNNNIMFKYEDNKATDVKLVDWQTPSYRTPTFDLVVLFMYQSWDIFHNQRDAILEHYHQELQKTLGEKKSIGLQLYTLDQLKADFRADCAIGVFERVLFCSWLLPSQQPDLLKIVQEVKNWGVI